MTRLAQGLSLLLLALLAWPMAAAGADRDGDGLRDRWEIRYGVTSPDRRDSDRDGVVDSAEDNDGDRLSNLGEQRFRTNPTLRDTDGDGRPDGREDHDGDGRSNAQEQDQRPLPRGLRPSLARAPRDFGGVTRGCDSPRGSGRLIRCRYGLAGSPTRIVLMGDSHAMMFADPLQRVASKEGWRLTTMLKGGCVPVLTLMNRGQSRLDGGRSCRTWRSEALAAIRAHPPDLVVIIANETYMLVDAAGRPIPRQQHAALWRRGMDRMLARIPERTDILVMGDVPQNQEHPVRCLKRNPGDISRCESPRKPLARRWIEQELRAATAAASDHFATLHSKICSYDPCPLVQGDTLMWRDRSHLTGTFARRLTPSLRRIVRSVVTAREAGGAP